MAYCFSTSYRFYIHTALQRLKLPDMFRTAEGTCKSHCMPDYTKGALANCIPKLCLLTCICSEAAVTPDTKSKAQN